MNNLVNLLSSLLVLVVVEYYSTCFLGAVVILFLLLVKLSSVHNVIPVLPLCAPVGAVLLVYIYAGDLVFLQSLFGITLVLEQSRIFPAIIPYLSTGVMCCTLLCDILDLNRIFFISALAPFLLAGVCFPGINIASKSLKLTTATKIPTAVPNSTTSNSTASLAPGNSVHTKGEPLAVRRARTALIMFGLLYAYRHGIIAYLQAQSRGLNIPLLSNTLVLITSFFDSLPPFCRDMLVVGFSGIIARVVGWCVPYGSSPRVAFFSLLLTLYSGHMLSVDMFPGLPMRDAALFAGRYVSEGVNVGRVCMLGDGMYVIVM